MRTTGLIAAAIFAAAIASHAAAQPSTTFTYQGFLKVDGQPATTPHDINFSAFGSEDAGPSLGSVFVDDIPMNDGRFEVQLDFGPALAGYEDIWLRLAIRDGDATGVLLNLPGRQAARPTPRAIRSATSSQLDVPNLSPNDTNRAVLASADANGGQLFINDETGNTTFAVTQSLDGNGAELLMAPNPANPFNRVFIQSNPGGIGDPYIEFAGNNSTTVFDTSQAGNNSVTLPNSAIGPEELLAETGYAGDSYTGALIDLDGLPAAVASATIACPSSGFVLVIATAEIRITDGDATTRLAISENPDDLPPDFYQLKPGSSGPTFEIVTMHKVFPVGPGLHSFHYNLQKAGTITNPRTEEGALTCIFIPSDYNASPERAAQQNAVMDELAALRDEINQLKAQPR